MCRLSCTATLILSINNNPPHCRPEPHLLITICHLSDAPPSPSRFFSPSLSLAVFSPSVCPSRASYPRHLPTPPSPQFRTRLAHRHGPAYRGILSLLPLTLSIAHSGRNLIITKFSSFTLSNNSSHFGLSGFFGNN